MFKASSFALITNHSGKIIWLVHGAISIVAAPWPMVFSSSCTNEMASFMSEKRCALAISKVDDQMASVIE